jgi:hypothetical protein
MPRFGSSTSLAVRYDKIDFLLIFVHCCDACYRYTLFMIRPVSLVIFNYSPLFQTTGNYYYSLPS